jgi:hypothetical protein
MSALLAGPTGWLAALGLALLVGIAVRLVFDRARRASRGRAARGQVAMDERIRARLEATIWPD